MKQTKPYVPHGAQGKGESSDKTDRIKVGTKVDSNRMTGFRFSFSDGIERTFYEYTEDNALVLAKTWGASRGGLSVQEGGAR